MMKILQQINRKQLLFLSLPLGIIFVLLSSSSAHSLGLKVTPLKYEESLEVGEQKSGYVDIANPNDSSVLVRTSVEGFRQINNQGDLEFFEDERLEAGITIDLEQFELGPREAVRIQFDINTNNLPEGGVYAALFFETDAQEITGDISGIGTTARVGTLLILQNGEGEVSGEISELAVPFWQFGTGITGNLSIYNEESERAVGFNPELAVKITPWGERAEQESGLVLPGVTRDFDLVRRGDYIGILPVTVYDEATGQEASTWVFAVTGLWRFILPFLTLSIGASLILQRYFQKR